MQQNKLLLGLGLAAVFFVGAGYIVYTGRPVMQLQQEAAVSSATPTSPTAPVQATSTASSAPVSASPTPKPTPTSPAPTPTPKDEPGVYTMATVAQHNSAPDCWSAINGNVYDLTSWVSRHPGGSGSITRLCGTDGSSSFERKHGGSARAVSMLALLKIGVLK